MTKGDNNYSLVKKLTKVSTNNFKMDIKRISRQSEISRKFISAQIFIYQAIKNVIPCCTRSVRMVLPKVNYRERTGSNTSRYSFVGRA